MTDLAARMREFYEARDRGRYHDLKSLTLALVGEVREVAELVQWLPAEQVLGTAPDSHLRAASARSWQTLLYLVRLADVAGIDLGAEAVRKLAVNESRFPVESVRSVAPEQR